MARMQHNAIKYYSTVTYAKLTEHLCLVQFKTKTPSDPNVL